MTASGTCSVSVAASLLAVLAMTALPALVQDAREIAKRRAEFEREDDPMDKARRFPRLGEELLKLMREQARRAEYEAARQTLEEYRDLARVAFEGLANSGVDAEKKSSGFRQLQIHLRRSIRDLNQTISSLPVLHREPFEAIQRELEQMNRALLEMLFPRRPARQSDNAASAGEGAT